MHACGHDAHTAMLLGAGILLNKVQQKLPGRVLLVFQPAEENSPVGGAIPMIQDGVFDRYQPDVIFGQHVWPDLPVGEIGIRSGPIMGNSDLFKVRIKGAGGHASMPHQTTDAIIVANSIIMNLQTIVSRNVNPLDSAVLSIGKIEGGSRHNVIAETVTFEGTVRTYRSEVKEEVKKRLISIVEGGAESLKASAEIEYLDGYPATVNTPEWAERIRTTAHQLLGSSSTLEIEPSLGGEDFGRFLLRYPGAFFWLGTALPNNEKQKPLHHSQFQIDERSLSLGVEMMAQAAIDTLFQLDEGKSEYDK